MTLAVEILIELQHRGISVVADGDTLCLKPRRALDNALLVRVREAKPAILEALRKRPGMARQALREATPVEGKAIDTLYSDLARDAVQRIAEVCPPGALKWAREVHPEVADKIDVQLFSRLNELWRDHAPLAEFQAALDELERAHGEVASLFKLRRKP